MRIRFAWNCTRVSITEIEISIDDDLGDYLDVLSWLHDLNIFSHRTVIIVA